MGYHVSFANICRRCNTVANNRFCIKSEYCDRGSKILVVWDIRMKSVDQIKHAYISIDKNEES